MKIETRSLGIIEISESEIINFPEGIFAFEHLHRYVILRAKADSNFFWLQNIEEPKLAFLLVKPSDLMPHYTPNISAAALELIGLTQLADAETWGIVTIPKDKPQEMTVNLQGPVLINQQLKLGGQFISENENHPVRASVLELIEKGGL